MKPKNKLQKQVVEASKSLPRLTAKQVQWGYENAVDHFAWKNAKGMITCTKCGHSLVSEGELSDTLLGHTCPNCGAELELLRANGRVFEMKYYMTIITAHKGYQVLRTVLIHHAVTASTPPQYSHSEVMQRWLAPNGKHHTFARNRQMMGTCYIDLWLHYTDLELRHESTNNKFYRNTYDDIPTGTIYPRIKLIPELKRTGVSGQFFGQKPLDLFRALMSDNRLETLLKARQTALFKCFLTDRGRNIDDCWASIRIAIRNDYKVKDASMWLDYLDFLRYFGHDLRNAHYVCPADLHVEHDRYMNKIATHRARREQYENPEEYKSKVVKFVIAKSKYFGLRFTDGQIVVRVLDSVAEIVAEGHAMHHCVGSYHSRSDSLILSATIDGKRIETVEVSLSKLQVIQSRGVCNGVTPYHEQIINLVNRNIPTIRQRMVA